MKKFLSIALAFVTATTTFALPPPKIKPPPSYNSGPKLIPPLRKDWNEPSRGGVSKSPNRQMANAVAISGVIATGLRLFEEATKPSQDVIIVFPDGIEGDVIIKEQEPVVKHPVPITVLPIEVIKSH